jgi:formate-dependent nitrite reductase cytochrome c552 subunit
MEPNPERRELTFHTEIRIRNHAEHQRWCLDCHDADDRDRLRLINGDTVDFKNSYFLCGQCHGGIFKDWKIGVHGKRTGYWDGPKKYMPCTYCHNPHSPRFRPIKPIAPPMRPDETLRR